MSQQIGFYIGTPTVLGGATGTVTSVAVATVAGVGGSVLNDTTTPSITITLGAITPTSVAAVGTVTGSNLSGTNTGDNAANTLYSGLVTNATHTGDATGSGALTVVALNGTSLAGLATGILKNTTATGVPSIAVAGDFPTLNQSTTGYASALKSATTTVDVAAATAPVEGQTLTATSGTLATWRYPNLAQIKTTTYQILITDRVIVANHATVPFTITLISAAANTSSQFTIKNRGAATVTLDATALGGIFGSALVNTAAILTGESLTVVSDGATWNVI